MKRIKPEEVVAAYRQKALKAESCQLEPGASESCCAIGALLSAKGSKDFDRLSYGTLATMLNLDGGERYVQGFVTGFDCGSAFTVDPDATDDVYKIGRADGAAVRKAMFQNKLWRNEEMERMSKDDY